MTIIISNGGYLRVVFDFGFERQEVRISEEYMYIGRNESLSEGFERCISRIEFNDIYPLKLLFQKNLNRKLLRNQTHPSYIKETKLSQVDEEKVRAAYNETDAAILGSVLAVILIALVITILIGRYMSRHKDE
ncbi:Neurexin-4 [Atta colombica]|uniref:Neurexin-4 n=1 Tax=Atta colombica TaxID=520822 RepID=A0A195B414_9HYME|nr:Neurexin-4 [Atta colombica]